MPKRNTRFLLILAFFIAAVKRGWTKTTDLILYLLTSDYELVGNDVLLAEYRKYAEAFNAMGLFKFLIKRVKIVNPLKEDVLKCLKCFPQTKLPMPFTPSAEAQKFLEIAYEAKADYIVTLERPLEHKIKILRPEEFLYNL